LEPATLCTPGNASAARETAITAAKADANVQRFMEGKPVRKAIYVPGKLVNIVV